MLWEEDKVIPVYLFPREDVRTDLLRPSEKTPPEAHQLIPADLAKDQTNIVLSGKRTRLRRPLELVPGDAVGYSFELVRLANTLKAEGHLGNVRMRLEVSDRLGRIHRCQFGVDTDFWAYSEELLGRTRHL